MSIFDCKSKTEVLLVQPPRVVGKNMNLPYGFEMSLNIPSLSAYLREKGIQSEILDMTLYNDSFDLLRKFLKELNPEFVGITSITADIYHARDIAKTSKELLPSAKTIIGGVHSSALPRETLEEFPIFDYLVFGEGELTLIELINTIRNNGNFESILGLAYRRNGDIAINGKRPNIKNIDALPFPARDKLDFYKYIPTPANYYRLPSMGLCASRGCPFNCTNCSDAVWGRSARFRTPENVIEELEYSKKKFGIKNFKIVDDTATTSKKWISTLCELMLSRNLDLTWNCSSRVDNPDIEVLKLMKKAGCFQIKYGVESGTLKALKTINKRATLEDAETTMKLCRKVGIESNASFMLGIPGETKEDIYETIKFANKISPDVVTYALLKPFPGSKVYYDAVKENKILHKRWNEYLHHGVAVMKHDILTQEELEALYKKAYDSFYFRWRFVGQRFMNIFRNPIREIKILLLGLKVMVLKR
jgi:anaerobic magnesium-protoporphyrin IX monomethyl ester cyclase